MKLEKRSRLIDIWKRLKRNRLAVVGLIIIVALVITAVFADVIAPYSYDKQDTKNSLAAPSAEHLLGTDKLGRDMLSRLIYGARLSLTIGVTATVTSAVMGMMLGALAGYYGGWVDTLVMRMLDIFQAIPPFLLCIVLAALLGAGTKNAILAMAICTLPQYARLLRGAILQVREKEYIEAVRMINASDSYIILRHIIPNSISPLIVAITMNIGSSILFGAMLSFIGLGAQPPLAEWGAMISDGRSYLRNYPTLMIYPGSCIMITVLAFNLFGDGLRDALDPRLKT